MICRFQKLCPFCFGEFKCKRMEIKNLALGGEYVPQTLYDEKDCPLLKIWENKQRYFPIIKSLMSKLVTFSSLATYPYPMSEVSP